MICCNSLDVANGDKGFKNLRKKQLFQILYKDRSKKDQNLWLVVSRIEKPQSLQRKQKKQARKLKNERKQGKKRFLQKSPMLKKFERNEKKKLSEFLLKTAEKQKRLYCKKFCLDSDEVDIDCFAGCECSDFRS